MALMNVQFGTNGQDTLTGTTGVDYLLGMNGHDSLLGGADNDQLDGGFGNDILDGGAGIDTLLGGAGNDTYIIDDLLDSLSEQTYDANDVQVDAGGLDTVQSSVNWTLGTNFENLVLTGTAAVGTGNSLDNMLTGNVSANTLNGGVGVDTLIGLAGDDTYVVDTTTDIITEAVGEGTDVVSSSVTYTLGVNVENLTLTGTAANGTGNTLANSITGNASANTLSSGSDAQVDTLAGGSGNDTYVIGAGDIVTEGVAAGTDTIKSTVTYTLGSNVENLTLLTGAVNGTGNTVANTITGNTAANTLSGGTDAVADTLVGGLGNDTYIVNLGDVVSETSTLSTEIDTVEASITYTLGTNVERLTLTGIAAINGTGNAIANLIVGNTAANILNSGTDALIDTLTGGTGTDTYVIGVNDIITDEALNSNEIDTVQSSATYTLGATSNLENLTLTGTAAINATGNSLNNILTGNTGINIFTGGDGDDKYVVSVGDTVTETNADSLMGGVDTIESAISWNITTTTNVEKLTLTGAAVINATGNSLANTITGNSAANILDGGADALADTLIGSLGNDTYIVGTGDSISETSTLITEIDTVQASANWTLGANLEKLTLTGTAATGTGNTLANTITGNAANNTLDGGAGIDTLIGGLGDDAYVVDITTDIITEAAGAGNDSVQSSATYTLSANLENLTLTGSTAINAIGNTSANVLTGNSGANTLTSGTDALVDTLIGGDGNDIYIVGAGDVVTETNTDSVTGGVDTVSSAITWSIATTANVENITLTGTTATNATGNTLANTLTGNSGNNILNGGDGTDSLLGGAGNDTYIVDSTSDIITDTSGIDTVQSSVSYTTLGGTLENLTLTGTAANGTGNTLGNILTGNASDNRLDGGTGNDTMIGGAGNDTYVVNIASDSVNDSSGIDTIESSITLTLISAIENLTLTGATAINGTGNALDNTLIGNTGANLLNGGDGADILTGGTGIDQFIINSVIGSDSITDFNSAFVVNAGLDDKLVLSNSGLNGIGNLDGVLNGAISQATTGGFATGAELVIFSGNIVGGITTTNAASMIGSASTVFADGDQRIFVVDNGTASNVYLFTATGSDAIVSSTELMLIGAMTTTAQTVVADYLFQG